MKPYHRICGSSDLGRTSIIMKKGKKEVPSTMDYCRHCGRAVESHEISRVDRRLTFVHAVINGEDKV